MHVYVFTYLPKIFIVILINSMSLHGHVIMKTEFFFFFFFQCQQSYFIFQMDRKTLTWEFLIWYRLIIELAKVYDVQCLHNHIQSTQQPNQPNKTELEDIWWTITKGEK